MKRMILAICCAFATTIIVGCDDKPKKPAGVEGELKPLPPPGSPGGGGSDKPKAGGKAPIQPGGSPTAG